jgi:WD domain, G-beta repeat
VWDAATGDVIAGPFTGHTEEINSVAFSPDGQRIVSASGDCTICMWHVTTGETEAGPSTGQTGPMEKVRTEDIEKTWLMDKFHMNSDGWMCGEEGEFLLWVPQIHRPYLHGSNTVWIVGKHYTELDFSNFVHGSNWTTVYVHSTSR